MLRQEELAFIKAMGTIKLSPVLLRELRKAMAASNKRKNVPASTSGVIDEATTTPEKPSACKRKTEEISNDSATDEPASRRRSAPGHLVDEEPEAQGATGEQAAQSSRQLGAAEGRLA
jgi:hypothetical protein